MKSIQVKIGKDGKPVLPKGTADFKKIDATHPLDVPPLRRRVRPIAAKKKGSTAGPLLFLQNFGS